MAALIVKRNVGHDGMGRGSWSQYLTMRTALLLIYRAVYSESGANAVSLATTPYSGVEGLDRFSQAANMVGDGGDTHVAAAKVRA